MNLFAPLKLTAVFVILIGAGVVTFVLEILSYLSVRQFSLIHHRKLVTAVSSCFLTMGTFLLEHWASIKLVTYGDVIPPTTSALCICNHASNIDWLVGLAWLSRFGYPAPGNVKCVVKASLGAVPIFGYILRLSEFIFLTRSWDKDHKRFVRSLRRLATFRDTGHALWMILFPEGSRLTTEKLVVSQNYARRCNYPVFNNVLLPRFKGFNALLPELRHSVDGILDITCMFQGKAPSMANVMDGSARTTIHIHVKNFPIGDVPADEDGMSKWLLERWIEKDARMGKFKDNPKSLGQPLSTPITPSAAPLFGLFATFLSFALPVLYAVSRFPNGIKYLLMVNTAFALTVLIFIAVNLRPSKKGKTKKKNNNNNNNKVHPPPISDSHIAPDQLVQDASEKEKDV